MTFWEFYSKSSASQPRYLSNFELYPITYRNVTFPSIEHAFQGAKYLYATGGERNDLFKDFSTQGVYCNITPAKVKAKGSEGVLKSKGVSLDIEAWNRDRDNIMYQLIVARCKVDTLYRKILRKVGQDKITLLHFEKKGSKSYWGGCFSPKAEKTLNHWEGRNMLGKIMNQVAKELNQSHQSSPKELSANKQ